MFPPIPTWENLHPVVIHFPIALLLFAPLFVAVALIFPARGRWASWAAALLLIGGTAGAFLAVETGEAARDLVKAGTDEMFKTLERHEQSAETTRMVFAILTGVYLVLLALPLLWKKLSAPYFHVVSHLIFLLALLGAGLLLAKTAHLGGRLVHEFGVHANLGTAPVESQKPAGSKSDTPKTPEEKPGESESESPKAPEEKPVEPESQPPTALEEKPDEPESETPKDPEEEPDTASP